MATDRLTDTAIRNAKPSAKALKMTDGGGLYLLLKPNGARWWRFDYRFRGKRKTLSMGVYPDTTLRKARAKREEARKMLIEGIDPSARRKAEKAAARAHIDTFRSVGDEWLEKQRHILADTTYNKAQWLLDFAYDHLGSEPIRELTPSKILACLRKIEARGHNETAHRVKGRISQVMRYAVATDRAETDPTYALRGALTPVKSTPRAAITDPAKLGDLLRAIESYSGMFVTRCALKLAPLLFVRPGELRAAEWSEFSLDSDEPLWRIPAEKTKMRTEHLVPLARQAVEILHELRPLTLNRRYLFSSVGGAGKPMSENTLNAALRRMGFNSSTICGHGFRAVASTLLNEQGWSPDVIERQLAHAERNKVRAVYNRAQYMAERRKMMQAWADYLDVLREDSGKVVPLRRTAS